MVEHLFCNQVMAVRFCHGAPRFVRIYSPIAQLVERLTVNQVVAGSIPARGASNNKVEIFLYSEKYFASVAQLVEQLFSNQ